MMTPESPRGLDTTLITASDEFSLSKQFVSRDSTHGKKLPGKAILKKLKKSAASARFQYSEKRTKFSSILRLRNDFRNGIVKQTASAKKGATKAAEEVLRHRRA